MTTPHVIHLRQPWQQELLPPTEAGDDVPATVRCTRRFNWPASLAADERVWLVCDVVEDRASFTLNDRHLGTIDGHHPQPRIDLTEVLATANVLVIDVAVPQGTALSDLELPGGLGDVRLEIGRHAPDWKIEELDQR